MRDMGYEDRARAASCGNCNRRVAWFDRSGQSSLPDSWRCECGAVNHFKPMADWPDVPTSLYIGPEVAARVKLYPVPPGTPMTDWALPYSIRSFVYQMSIRYGECQYRPFLKGSVMGEPVFSDVCYDTSAEAEYGDDEKRRECHIMTGWMTGQRTCGLWQRIEALCQTPSERRFLWNYLSFVKDRQFPMLIPQVWLGIADRRRVDFVAFVPLQYWKYTWLAIQLDASHPEELAASDALRDEYVRGQKYEVLSLRPSESGYLEEVRSLVEQIDRLMALSDVDPWQTAVDAQFRRVEKPTAEVDPDDIPF